MPNIKAMQIYPIAINWYLANGYINNKHIIGYGTTHFEALQSAIKDYQIIINLK